MQPLLSFSSVNAGYEETPVLHDVSIEINPESIVSLLGQNGAGKTTLMKTAMGILTPTSGTILYNDADITADPPRVRAKRGIGYVPQDRGLFPKMTVKENLLMGTNVNEGRPAISFDQIFGYFPRLEERLSQKAGTLSGGEQQMLAIGRAIAGEPELLILDEVSEGVQPSIIESIQDILLQINSDLDTAIFIAEQNLDLVDGLGSKAYILKKGSIKTSVSQGEFDKTVIASEHLAL